MEQHTPAFILDSYISIETFHFKNLTLWTDVKQKRLNASFFNHLSSTAAEMSSTGEKTGTELQ